jgi:formylglycine-generating enzyme required for sulfatase activity
MELELPSEIEEYRLVRLLGSGAMGRVYLAEDRLLDRLVAIKFIAAGGTSKGARDRFFTEARAAARITHANVVAVYRVAEFKRQPFLVAEYVRGRSLAELSFPVDRVRFIEIARDLARGLAAAHRRGVLHRDIKPANAMISEDGITKLVDFGLAELMHEAAPDGKAALAGTPNYMAPELWTGAAPSPHSDLYALGVVLFELYSGTSPSTVPLSTRVESPDLEVCSIIERCIARDPAERFTSADALVTALEDLTHRSRTEPFMGSPYRGLLAFEAEHRDLFFGRRAEAAAIHDRLRRECFVVVAGDSGTGKSSLCRAAILPLFGSGVDVVSVALGRAASSAFASALAPLLAVTEEVARERLLRDPSEVSAALHTRDREVVFFIDQLEELVTQASRADAELVADIVNTLARSESARVLATARSDFLTRLAALRGFGDGLASALTLLRPLSRERLVEVVVEPAAAMGFAFESEAMVRALIADVRVDEGGLPLLQFALGELWEARDAARKLIPETALAAIGGVAGALARHADSVIGALHANERAAARAILVALVTAEGTRAHRAHDELLELASQKTSRARAVLDALVAGRLLVARESDAGGQTIYAIVHEALLSSWGTLRGWLDQDVEGRAAKQRIERAAGEWERQGRRADALWTARQLADANKVETSVLTARELAFVSAARRRVRRRRIALWAAILAVPALLGAGLFLVRFQRDARRRDEIDAARTVAADARIKKTRYLEARGHAFDRFDRGSSDAESLWDTARGAETVADGAFADAEQRVERVLQDAPDDETARALLAGILLDRAELADLAGRTSQYEDLVRRAALYDASAAKNATATVELTVRAPEPTILIRRYAETGGRLSLSEARPWTGEPIPAGSIVLEVSAPGRERVRVPLLLKRRDTVRLTIDLPSSSPPGFVYVPAGPFLYGSGGDEDLRPMYMSEPLHTVTTPAYWIADTETTYGQWIEFLASLPEAERISRMPNTSRQDFVVKLVEADGGFVLTIGQKAHPQTVREGERLRYPRRESHVEHDWSNLPVTGISYRDALAYAAWLGNRVPGARICTEWEWEHANRGADGRVYPHGNRLDPGDANFDRTYDQILDALGPDEVGTHPVSDSVYGVHDLAGNVWELTSSHSDPTQPVSRGGSFFQADVVARAMNRQPDVPDRRDAFYGLRICASN